MPDLEEVFRMSTQKVRPEPGALERQFGKQRKRATRQRFAVYALVVILVAGTAIGVASLGGDEERPADPGPEPSTSLPTIEGRLPTPSRVAGIWLSAAPDGEIPVLVRFSLDGTFAIDNGVRLDTAPFALGTYEIDGRTITFTADGSMGCLDGMTWVWEVGIPADGQLEGVVAADFGSEVGACSGRTGEPWSLTRVSPSSPGGSEIDADELGPGAAPPSSQLDVIGIWLRRGTTRIRPVQRGDARDEPRPGNDHVYEW
jgi:hypothetical protein